MGKILALNWKMNLLSAEARALTRTAATLSNQSTHSEIWIAPSFVLLPVVLEGARNSKLRVGAQNVHWEKDGAFTGEVSAPQLKELGCHFSIVGHSERRQHFGETAAHAAARAAMALGSGLDVIFCIGETLEARLKDHTYDVLASQLLPFVEALGDATIPAHARLILAYEPVWAIGTGKAASLEDISAAHAFVIEWWKKNSRVSVPSVLYGGSATPDNFLSILSLKDVAGGLIGKAGLSESSLKALVEGANSLY